MAKKKLIKIPKDLQGCCSLLLYLPDQQLIMYVSDGTGEQLLPEDLESGYNDYINWHSSQYIGDGVNDSMFEDDDGGIYLYDDAGVNSWTDVLDEAVVDAVGDVKKVIVLGDGEV